MICGAIAVILAVILGVSFLAALYLAGAAPQSGPTPVTFEGVVPPEVTAYDDPSYAEELAFERALELQKEMRGNEDPFREMY